MTRPDGWIRSMGNELEGENMSSRKPPLSGRTFDAAEAAQLGLVNRVVPATELLAAAISLAKDLASKPPVTVAAALMAAAWMQPSTMDWRSKKQPSFASSRRMTPGKAWPHFWRSGCRVSSAGSAVPNAAAKAGDFHGPPQHLDLE